MKKSIKWKMTIWFIVVMVCLVGSILLFNTLFLENLYINKKKNVIKNSYYALENGIMEAYKEGYTLDDLFKRRKDQNGLPVESSLLTFIRELQEIYGVTVVLMDSENKTYSLFQSSARLDRRMMDYIFKDGASSENLKIIEKTSNYTIAISTMGANRNLIGRNEQAPPGPNEYYENAGPGEKAIETRPERGEQVPRKRNNSSDLECFGFLSDEATAFFLDIPIDSIKEPIDLFNRVLIVVSIIALIIGSIIIFILSNSLTKPLLELAKISKKMSRLEFENKYEGNSTDEIGVLGDSMNELSDKLEKSIRELKNANYMLKKDLEQKEQLDIMRQEFVANVSHELKTPISLIKGYAEGLETAFVTDSKESKDYYISVIKDEADKMGNMVKQLLDLSAIERGVDNVDFDRINLKELIDGVMKSFEIKFKEKEVNIKINVNGDWYVWADGYKLEEVMRNYLSNAINHLDDNKIIEVTVKSIDVNTLRFSVFNSGIQLPDEEIEKIWDKFYKVDKAHTRAYGGTGLGLSIVKAIAKEHNTDFGCFRSSRGDIAGMEFYFDLSKK